ncbi:Clathrin heavy chain 1 [Histomonas meleagridis]|nr:Clathrin heavy chain 1 [Histomonas meleagridis]
MSVPINTTEVLNFQQFGIDPKFASISNTSLSKDKYLCVREVTETEGNVVIIDLQQNNSVTRHKNTADSAVMHPSRNVIAMRGGNVLQVFDLGARQRLKSFQLNPGQTVSYWTWLDDDILAFVSSGQVYHWSLSSQNNPIPIFQVQPPLSNGSIMKYSMSHDQQWVCISGLAQEGNQIVGKLQLYSRERNASQMIDAFAFEFGRYQTVPILIFSNKNQNGMFMNIIPLGASPAAQQFGKKNVDLPIANDAQGDIPLQLLFSQKYDTAYLLTKMGYLYLVEVETPFVYISARVSQTPFIHASLTREGGIIALSRDGRMTKLTINDSTIIEFVAKTRGNPQSASHIASSAGLQISGDFMNQQLDQLIRQGNYVEAAHCAANSPGGSLRNMQTIQKLLSIQTMGGAPPLLQYFNELLNITKLNEVESIELCRIVVNLNKTNLIEKWIKEDKLTPSEALGDVCRPDPRIAVAIYLRANVSEKVVATFAEMNAFDKLQAYCQKDVIHAELDANHYHCSAYSAR